MNDVDKFFDTTDADPVRERESWNCAVTAEATMEIEAERFRAEVDALKVELRNKSNSFSFEPLAKVVFKNFRTAAFAG